MDLCYNVIVCSFCASKYFAYDNNLRIIILILTYPLLAWNCYNLSLTIHMHCPNYCIFFQIILFSLIINYFQVDEIFFDIDDIRRNIIIVQSLLLFFLQVYKILY
jgi:hypothetical protein